jgi:predicted dehydrogenase
VSVLKLGLIGCGRAAEHLYAPVLARAAGVQVIAATDPVAERRDLVARRLPECRAVGSAEELVRLPGLDGVIVATPPAEHAAVARLARRADLAVLIEKPLAATLEEALEMASFFRGYRRTVMVGFNRRRWRAIVRLKRALRVSPPPRDARIELLMLGDMSVWSPIAGPAGALEDLASHQFDLLRHLFGCEIATVAARSTSATEFEMTVELASGHVARLRAGHVGASRESIRVGFGRRVFEARMGSMRIAPASGGARRLLDLADRVARALRREPSSLTHSFRLQIETFARGIRTGEPVAPNVADGVAAAAAVAAAQRSLRQGGAPARAEPAGER